jgi:hypothetical protein
MTARRPLSLAALVAVAHVVIVVFVARQSS